MDNNAESSDGGRNQTEKKTDTHVPCLDMWEEPNGLALRRRDGVPQ